MYKVCLDANQVSQNDFKGLGVQWDPYVAHPVSDKEWEMITERVDYLKPSFVRLMIYAPSYCKGVDENQVPIYDFDGAPVASLLRELDYLEEHGIETILGEWEAPYQFGGAFEGITTESPLWAKMIVGLLHFLLEVRGYTCIKYFNYVNEANAEWSLCADIPKWKKGIQYLHQELQDRKLLDRITIIGPDTVWDEGDTWLKYLATDKELDDLIGLYDVHMYPSMEEIQSGEVERHVRTQRGLVSGKDFYMTEVGMVTGKYDGDSQLYIRDYSYGVAMADIACQVVNGGFSGLSIWALDDAMHTQNNGYPLDDIRSLKQWGFFNSVAGRVFQMPEDERIRPHFYTWSLMTRLFPRNCKILTLRVEKTADDTAYDSLRLLAMRKEESDQEEFAVMAVNHGEKDVDIELSFAGFSLEQKDIYQYMYNADLRPTDEKGYPMIYSSHSKEEMKHGFAARIPAMSVLFITSHVLM